MSDAPEQAPITSKELIAALDDPKVRKAVRIPGVTDWYEERIVKLEAERDRLKQVVHDLNLNLYGKTAAIDYLCAALEEEGDG